MAPISPLWDPRLKGASPADSLSGVCQVQSFYGRLFAFHGKLNTFFVFIRFSTEDVSPSTPEKKPKPTTPTRQRASADWLGLKVNDDHTVLEGDAKETKTSTESPKAPSSPSLERRPSLTSSHGTSAAKAAGDTAASTANIPKQTKPEVSKSQQREEEEEEEEDDWLAGALSRKKALSVSKTSKQGESFSLGEDLESTIRYTTKEIQ